MGVDRDGKAEVAEEMAQLAERLRRSYDAAQRWALTANLGLPVLPRSSDIRRFQFCHFGGYDFLT
jgi:hypothetical protein